MSSTVVRQDLREELRQKIRDIPDFPRPGILFKDITPVLSDARLFAAVTDAMAQSFRDSGITHVIGIESRGFILGAPIAQRLDAGFVPVRKPGKLPAQTETEEYQLEYGTDRLEIHADACADHATPRVLIVDDVLATGGTAQATRRLVGRLGVEVAGFCFLIALGFLRGVERLRDQRVEVLLTY